MRHIGIIGTGSMAATMVAAMKHVPGLQPAAVLSGDRARAHAFAKAHAIPAEFDDLTQFLAQEGLNGVYIANSNVSHFASAKAALDAGLAVFAEKPLTLSSAETNALCALAEQNGAPLLENLWTLTLPAYRALKAQLGELNEHGPHHLTFDFSIPTSRKAHPGLFTAPGGGVLFDRAVYGVAAAIDLLGPVILIKSTLIKDKSGIEIRGVLLLEHEAGATSTITVAFDAAGDNALHVACAETAFRLTPSLAGEWLDTHQMPFVGRQAEGSASGGGLKQRLKQAAFLRRLKGRLGSGPAFHTYGQSPYQPVLQEFEKMLATANIQSDLIPHQLSAAVSQIIAQAKESA